MTAAWDRWVRTVDRPIDARPLAAVRIAVCTALLADLASAVHSGLAPIVWRPAASGGLAVPGFGYTHGLGALVGDDAGGVVALLLAAAGLLLGALGVLARPAIFAAAVALSQLAWLAPTSDRGIDRLLRIALLMLAASPSDRAWRIRGGAPQHIRGDAPRTIPAWPADLLRFQWILVYTGAGAAKLLASAAWWSGSGVPELARVLGDPVVSRVTFGPDTWPLLRVAGAATVLFELAAPLLWTRYARAWCALGVAFHLATAVTLDLGLFPYGMLAIYPVLWQLGAGRPTRSPLDASTPLRPVVGKTLHDGS